MQRSARSPASLSRQSPRPRAGRAAACPGAKTSERYIGIDVGAREYQVAVLSRGAEWLESRSFTTPTDLADWLTFVAPAGGGVAVDAPLRTAEGLMHDAEYRARLAPSPPPGRYLSYRECDYHLARRRLPLYLVPTRYAECPGWMRAGFAVYDSLLTTGRWSLFDGGPGSNWLAEVYPFAAFAVLLGHIPDAKHTPAGRAARITVLRRQLSSAPPFEQRTHHELDAAVAAVTALALAEGQASWVGNPREGLIVLPGPLADRYERSHG